RSGRCWLIESVSDRLTAVGADVLLIPSYGLHVPNTPEEDKWIFWEVPEEKIHVHDWRDGVTHAGTIPAEYVAEETGGAVEWEVPIDLNTMLMEEPWDLIINVGHIVPHEVLGFANHN